MAKVSICVPVYNVEKYIARCLESILSQSYENIEVIVVNDCTPDKSMEIVQSYADSDNRIRIINHETNRGLMWARRTGYMAATGDYITFCDSDDSLVPKAIELLVVRAMETGADIVSGLIKYVDTQGGEIIWKHSLKYGNDSEAVLKSLLKKEFGHNLCSKLFTKSILQDYDYWTIDKMVNAEDGLLFYQLLSNAKKIVMLHDVVYNYIKNATSSTHVEFSDNAINGIVEFIDYVYESSSRYPELESLKNHYLAIELNTLALNCGLQRIQSALKDSESYKYVKFVYRLKYLTFKEFVLWNIKYVLSRSLK